MTTKTFASLLLIFAVFLIQCKRDDEILTNPSAKIEFSIDTLSFDTVFTTIGSATQVFTVYNKNDKTVKISSVRLSGETSSYYKINIDGSYGTVIKDIEIGANDSAFVFVQVQVDPTKQNAPLLILDSLLFELNGNVQNVKLCAWGQDVHMIKDSTLKTQTWINDKPYLIYGYALVDSFSTLTIEEGVTIYMHRDCIFAAEGNIICNGTREKPVVFRGDRLDDLNMSPPVPYDKIANQWDRIVLANSSTGNKFTYTEIRSGGIGLQVGLPGKEGIAELELVNCKIENHGIAGLLAFEAKVDAYNCLFSNAVSSLFMCWEGGEYTFNHCTFANYYVFGESPGISLYLCNLYPEKDENGKVKHTYYGDLKKAYFGNCLIFAQALNSVYAQPDTNDYAMEYTFENCLIRGTVDNFNVSDQSKFIKTKIDTIENPGFKLIDTEKKNFDFQLKDKSKARNAGSKEIANKFPVDFYGNSRIDDVAPDLGAFEYVNPSLTR